MSQLFPRTSFKHCPGHEWKATLNPQREYEKSHCSLTTPIPSYNLSGSAQPRPKDLFWTIEEPRASQHSLKSVEMQRANTYLPSTILFCFALSASPNNVITNIQSWCLSCPKSGFMSTFLPSLWKAKAAQAERHTSSYVRTLSPRRLHKSIPLTSRVVVLLDSNWHLPHDGVQSVTYARRGRQGILPSTRPRCPQCDPTSRTRHWRYVVNELVNLKPTGGPQESSCKCVAFFSRTYNARELSVCLCACPSL
jgi:hypothetical protein